MALDSLDDTILVKTERMRGVEVDPDARTARVEAGVLVLELGEAAQAHGLSSLPGSSPDVGVTGYTLGGGLSWLARRYGFACNRVRAIELVTADGEPRTVDAENEPDLFWALRGGGGGYAIVTALQLDLVPIADIYAGALLFPAAVGAEAVRTYRDWAAGVSEDVTSVVRFVTPPPIPDVPEPLRGTPLLTIDAACIGDQASGEATIAPLREIGEPIMDTFDQMPAAGLCRIHMDPESPVPGLGDHALLRELPDEAIEAFTGLAGPESDTPLLLTELRHAGGALSRPAENGGALSHLDAEFVMFGIGMPMTPGAGRGDQRPPRPLRRDDAPLGRRRRLLQLRRAPLRHRRDPARRGLLEVGRGQAPLRPRRPDRRQPRGCPGASLANARQLDELAQALNGWIVLADQIGDRRRRLFDVLRRRLSDRLEISPVLGAIEERLEDRQ